LRNPFRPNRKSEVKTISSKNRDQPSKARGIVEGYSTRKKPRAGHVNVGVQRGNFSTTGLEKRIEHVPQAHVDPGSVGGGRVWPKEEGDENKKKKPFWGPLQKGCVSNESPKHNLARNARFRGGDWVQNRFTFQTQHWFWGTRKQQLQSPECGSGPKARKKTEQQLIRTMVNNGVRGLNGVG